MNVSNKINIKSLNRRQGKCGSCYAFAVADLLGAQHQIDRKKSGPLPLSPQFLVDCMKFPAALGCSGGRPSEVIRNLTACVGGKFCNFPTESCYAYQGKKGSCQRNSCQLSPSVRVSTQICDFWVHTSFLLFNLTCHLTVLSN